MLGFLGKRIVQLIVVLWGISTLLFFLIRLSGDPARLIAGPDAPPAQVDQIRVNLGLEGNLIEQYVRFLGKTVQLDFGTSFRYQVSAMAEVVDKLPATLLLAVSAIVLSLLVAIPAGVFAAVKRGKPAGTATTTMTLIGQSIPDFVVGILLILIFAVQFSILPSFGLTDWKSLILPTITLSFFITARQTRLVRSLMLEELSKDYVRSAIANGIPVWRLRSYLVLRNALVPVLGLLAIDLAGLFGGAVVVESIFAWPGMGRLLLDSVTGRDYPVLQAAVFLIAVIVVIINLSIEAAHRAIDPTLRRPAA